ncbi:MAG: rRNA maturation RNase YbeY [Odoribacter sp.]|nr:rRNA maturation RNase YbeY [Odoribacter sp.]
MKDILFFKEGNVEYPSFFSESLISEWLDLIASHYDRKLGAINFVFCDDDYILSVNRQYLKHDYYTDVITFDYCSGDCLSGDVFISLDTVKSNSELFNVTFENEFHRVICHSVLHLIGFKDKTEPDSAEIRNNENICLDLLKTL